MNVSLILKMKEVETFRLLSESDSFNVAVIAYGLSDLLIIVKTWTPRSPQTPDLIFPGLLTRAAVLGGSTDRQECQDQHPHKKCDVRVCHLQCVRVMPSQALFHEEKTKNEVWRGLGAHVQR